MIVRALVKDVRWALEAATVIGQLVNGVVVGALNGRPERPLVHPSVSLVLPSSSVDSHIIPVSRLAGGR